MIKKIFLSIGILLAVVIFMNANVYASDNKAIVNVSIVNGEDQSRVKDINVNLYEYLNDDYKLIEEKITNEQGIASFSVEANKKYKVVMLQNKTFVPGKDIDFIIKEENLNNEYFLNECGELFEDFVESMIIYPVSYLEPLGYPVTKEKEIQTVTGGGMVKNLPKDFPDYREYIHFIRYPKSTLFTLFEIKKLDSITYTTGDYEYLLKQDIDYKHQYLTQEDGSVYLMVSYAPSFLKSLKDTDYQNGVISVLTEMDIKPDIPAMTGPLYIFPPGRQAIENQYGKKFIPEFLDDFQAPEFNVWEKPAIVNPCPIRLVTPIKPHLEDQGCDKAPKLVLPEQDGVSYEVKQEGNKYLVDAIIDDSYELENGAETHWIFEYEIEKCEIDKPGTTNPTNPLPETGNINLFVAVLTITMGLLTLLALKKQLIKLDKS